MANKKALKNLVVPEEEVNKKVIVRDLQIDLANMTLTNLPELIEKKKEELSAKLEELFNLKFLKHKDPVTGEDKYIEFREINSIAISEYLFKPLTNIYVARPIYTAEKLSIVFELYRELVLECNLRGWKLVPNKSHFCNFAGISTSTYRTYQNSDDIAMRNVCEIIDDYAFDKNVSSAQHRETELATTMYRMKVEEGKIEPVAPQQHVLIPNADMKQIASDIQRIKEKKVVYEYDYIEQNNSKYSDPKRDGKKRPIGKNK